MTNPLDKEHKELLSIMRLAFPDLPDDTEIFFSKSNPFCLGGIGTFAQDSIKIVLQPYEISTSNPDGSERFFKFTAGTYKLGRRIYVVIQETAFMGGEFTYLIEERKKDNATGI